MEDYLANCDKTMGLGHATKRGAAAKVRGPDPMSVFDDPPDSTNEDLVINSETEQPDSEADSEAGDYQPSTSKKRKNNKTVSKMQTLLLYRRKNVNIA